MRTHMHLRFISHQPADDETLYEEEEFVYMY